MTEPRFIQIHYLTAYPASLLNRDDAGMAKRVPFGGASRIRISSQCLKRHWRCADGEHSLKRLGVEPSVRSRVTFETEIAKPLIEDGLDEEVVRAVLKEFQRKLLGESAKAEKKKKDEKVAKVPLNTSQVIILGRPEIEYIKSVAREIVAETSVKDAEEKVKAYLKDKEHGKNLEALKKASSAGLDAALFGRMVTSDLLARGDAAVHVAHAFTVHTEEAESDYFTAVDDLELGSGHLGESELTSGLFYGYVVVDVLQLISNLEGVDRKEMQSADRTLAAQVVENLIHLVATVSPGAKLGSTAPYAYAQMVLVEVGKRQPRTLANAFLKPVNLHASGDVLQAAVDAIGRHLKDFERMYGGGEIRRITAMTDVSAIPAENVESLASLARWVADQVGRRS